MIEYLKVSLVHSPLLTGLHVLSILSIFVTLKVAQYYLLIDILEIPNLDGSWLWFHNWILMPALAFITLVVDIS